MLTHIIMSLVTLTKCKDLTHDHGPDSGFESTVQVRQAVTTQEPFRPVTKIVTLGDTAYIGTMWGHSCEHITEAILGD